MQKGGGESHQQQQPQQNKTENGKVALKQTAGGVEGGE